MVNVIWVTYLEVPARRVKTLAFGTEEVVDEGGASVNHRANAASAFARHGAASGE